MERDGSRQHYDHCYLLYLDVLDSLGSKITLADAQT